MTTRILTGDARRVLAELADGSVGMCLTSPPYYGLRDYGHDDQIGLEATPEAFVRELVAVFREVRRVLRDDGVLFVNIGDSYANDGKWGGSSGGKHAKALHGESSVGRGRRVTGLKPKDLIGIPWMLAFALRADGWTLRQELIWSKPNPMPESVRDRCTKAHESVFLLAKSERYFFDVDAIAEQASFPAGPGNKTALKALPGERCGDNANIRGSIHQIGPRATRNARSVWTFATKPSQVAHFATMAPALAERCIRAGTSEHGCCASCGARWKRQTRPQVDVGHTCKTASAYGEGSTANRLATLRQAARAQGFEFTGARVTIGWVPGCMCADPRPPVRDSVLDPFGGAGTTALVADQLQRDAVLVELNPSYSKAAVDRICGDSSLFAEVAQ